MEWLQFEHEVRALVEAFGYQAETTQPSHDFGVDVIAHSNRRTVVVQCKLYGRGSIGGDTLMKLVGSRHYFKASDALCITTSRFTKQAQEIAAKENIGLVDCEKLILLCRQRYLTIPSLTVLVSAEQDVFMLDSPETSIGRAPDNHIIVSSPLASRRHALLKREGLRLSLHECKSTNGTKLNGQCVTSVMPVNYYDTLTVANMNLTLVLQTPNRLVKFQP